MTTNKQVCVLWKNQSKNGTPYFTGVMDVNNYEQNVTAFYNTKKSNPKEPDLKIYQRSHENKLFNEPILSLWVNVSPAKNIKYLTGKLNGKRVVGFINESKADFKRPYITIYLSEDKKEVPATTTASSTQHNTQQPLNIAADDLPF